MIGSSMRWLCTRLSENEKFREFQQARLQVIDSCLGRQIVLLDLPELWRLGIEYMPQLRMYEDMLKHLSHCVLLCLIARTRDNGEDICLNHDVLSKGGRTLKCQGLGLKEQGPTSMSKL